MTHAHAKLWGNAYEQALVWAALSPDSPRAQSNAAQYEMAAGQLDAAAERLRRALAKQPAELQLALNLLAVHCELGDIRADHVASIETALADATYGLQLTFTWLDKMVNPIGRGACPGLNLPILESFVLVARANPRLNNSPGRAQELEHVLGRIALLRSNPESALSHFNLGLQAEPREAVALKQAALLGSAGYPRHGVVHLDRYADLRPSNTPPGSGMRRLHNWIVKRQGYYETEFAHMRATLEADAQQQVEPERSNAPADTPHTGN